MPRGAQRTAQLGVLREQFLDAVNADDDRNKGVIRFDLKFPVAVKEVKPRELWIDHAIVQETSPTHAGDTLNFLEEDLNHLPEDSPAFTKLTVGKSGGTKHLLRLSIVLRKNETLNSNHPFSIQLYRHWAT